MLALLSGGAYSHARLALFIVPVAVAFRFRLSITIAATLVTTAAYVLQAAFHPAAGQPDAPRFIVTQAGYLAWVGVGCILLSLLLARRTATVERLAHERSALLADALEAEQRERRALAEALHDHAIQNLLSARHDLQEAGEVLPHPALARADAALAQTVGQLREAVFDLHPYVLEQAGLDAALRSIAQQVATRSHLDLRLDLHPAGRHPQEQLAFSAARELLANVAQHAQATHVRVGLAAGRGHARAARRGRRHGLPAGAPGPAAGGGPRRPRVPARAHRGGRRHDGRRVRARRRHAGRGAAAGPLAGAGGDRRARRRLITTPGAPRSTGGARWAWPSRR